MPATSVGDRTRVPPRSRQGGCGAMASACATYGNRRSASAITAARARNANAGRNGVRAADRSRLNRRSSSDARRGASDSSARDI